MRRSRPDFEQKMNNLAALDFSPEASLAKVVLVLAGGVLCVLGELGAVCNPVAKASAVDAALSSANGFELLQFVHGIIQSLHDITSLYIIIII